MNSWAFKIGFDKVTFRKQIIGLNGELIISIYNLDQEPLKNQNGKMYFYGDDNGKLLAFELNFRDDQLDEIITAISWYARYINNPQMPLLIKDPRPLVN